MARILQREIDDLKRSLLSLCATVEKQVGDAAQAVDGRDVTLARQVMASDRRVDAGEVEIEEECLKLLALHQPVAIDLRVIISILKINNDLERIGDLATGIAACTEPLAEAPPAPEQMDLPAMVDKVRLMLRQSVDAMVEMDAAQARGVAALDEDVDAMNARVRATMVALLKEGYRDPGSLVLLGSVAQNLERIADHACNIAEDIVYMTQGEIVRHHVNGS